jgi:hypothetical protein
VGLPNSAFGGYRIDGEHESLMPSARDALPRREDIWSPSGRANTSMLLSASRFGEDDAVSAVVGYNGGGLHDWSLPSRDELRALYRYCDRV